MFAADGYSEAGLVMNLNGKDIFLKHRLKDESKGYTPANSIYSNGNLNLTIDQGRSSTCSPECAKANTVFNITSGNSKIVIQTFSICGS